MAVVAAHSRNIDQSSLALFASHSPNSSPLGVATIVCVVRHDRGRPQIVAPFRHCVASRIPACARAPNPSAAVEIVDLHHGRTSERRPDPRIARCMDC
jgi:hypothetical protein